MKFCISHKQSQYVVPPYEGHVARTPVGGGLFLCIKLLLQEKCTTNNNRKCPCI